jgi:hypothetical protein
MLAVEDLQAAPSAPSSRRRAAEAGSPLSVPPVQGRGPTGQTVPRRRGPA